MAKRTEANNQTGFEETLWDSANKLRGSVESSEYKHVVLSLIFLKFISDKFEERKEELIAEGKEKYLEMVEFYAMKNVFYLPEESRWSYIKQHAKQDDLAIKIDTALFTVENNNKSLKGALPDNYFSRLGLDSSKLAALIDTISNIDTVRDKEEDVVGRVYEYFLGKFAVAEGKGKGEFYTPSCVVKTIAEMIEPYSGKIYDPCMGSGGMFVQSMKFVESHQGNRKDLSIYGQEYTNTTYKLAKMNLAIRGIASNLGDSAANTFVKDQHPDLKADFVMANPPFNQKEWRGADELLDDPRWAGYEVPPTGNANYAWILHMLSKLSTNGVAGFVMANGSMSTNTSGEGAIRQKLIENDHVDCMIALPGQLFYTTQIPVCLWFLSKSKGEDKKRGFRNRKGETLFIDARHKGALIDRTHRELSTEEITEIARTYHAWRGAPQPPKGGVASQPPKGGASSTSTEESAITTSPLGERGAWDYKDIPGFCKSATLEEMKSHHYVLTPGRYVGAAEVEDDLPAPRPGTFVVYAIRCDDDSIYIGQTDNIPRRWSEHRKGTAADWTKKHKPIRIVHYEEYSSREEAVEREKELKTTSGRRWLKEEIRAGRARQAGRVLFEEKMVELTDTLYKQMKESNKLDKVIRKNLEYLGFGE